jgi:hypothetical protein
VITLLTVKHVTAAVVTFPLYIAVFAFVEVLLVGGRLGPRVRRDPEGTEEPAPGLWRDPVRTETPAPLDVEK